MNHCTSLQEILGFCSQWPVQELCESSTQWIKEFNTRADSDWEMYDDSGVRCGRRSYDDAVSSSLKSAFGSPYATLFCSWFRYNLYLGSRTHSESTTPSNSDCVCLMREDLWNCSITAPWIGRPLLPWVGVHYCTLDCAVGQRLLRMHTRIVTKQVYMM